MADNPLTGRDDKGKFTRGNSGGPGRPRRKDQDSFYRALKRACTLKDFREIADKTVAQAKRGDRDARAILFKYLLGEPEQFMHHEFDTPLVVVWDERVPKSSLANPSPSTEDP